MKDSIEAEWRSVNEGKSGAGSMSVIESVLPGNSTMDPRRCGPGASAVVRARIDAGGKMNNGRNSHAGVA